MAKIYAIVRNGNNIYVPIKANLSPYDEGYGNLYSAGMPNFFGGKIDDYETPQQALTRELREESQGNIMFNPPPPADPLPDSVIPQAQIGYHTYDFYVLNGNTTPVANYVVNPNNNLHANQHVNLVQRNFVPIPNALQNVQNVSIMELNSRPQGNLHNNIAKYYENQIILSIPNTAFARNGGMFTNDSYGLIQLCYFAVGNTVPNIHAATSNDGGTPMPQGVTEFLNS